MSETMTFTLDDKAFQEGLKGMTNQIPYAMSVAINGLAKDVQTATNNSIKNEMHIRRANFLKLSNKISQFAKKDNLEAVVGIVPVGENEESVFTKFEDGGTKQSISGGNIAVPNRDDMRIAIGTVIPQRLRPRNLPTATTFKIVQNTGRAFIFSKVGRGRNKTYQLFYILQPQVTIKPILHYYSTADVAIIRNYEQRVEAAINKAIETAK